MMDNLAQILILLSIAVAVILVFQRLRIPTSLGYLFVGLLLGPHTMGPNVYALEFSALAEFGVVFLLFTIGLSFSLPQLHALRHQVLGLGTGQVVLTTLVVAVLLWLFGMPGVPAFVIGAVFAQSSTTIISSLLNERREENSKHGRMGVAISVFQDVTAVPFLVVIPVLGMSVGAGALAMDLGWAMTKAVLAFGLVFFLGRWLLRPLFHRVTESRSSELFTLAVLLVALLAAWTTSSFGLSLAFGGFLAGMMLGETEFRHQVESSVKPFRDVLLGLFFVGIGMRIDPISLPPIWYWVVLGALLIVVSKFLIVAAMMKWSGFDLRLALRTGLMLTVGGEFGFALLVIAQDSGALNDLQSQIIFSAVLLAMIIGALLIRFNQAIVDRLAPAPSELHRQPGFAELPESSDGKLVVIGGYGRVGHTIAVLLNSVGVRFVAFDTDMRRVVQGRKDGFDVAYGDISDQGLLSSLHVERAALVVITTNNSDAALQTIDYISKNCPHVPVVARAHDLNTCSSFLQAGVTYAYPETIEASLRLGATAMQILQVPSADIEDLMKDVRDWNYRPVAEGSKESGKQVS